MEILYKDQDIVVAVKPVGMDSEKAFPEALQAQIGGTLYAVHRLDLNVGGVMLLARNTMSAAYMCGAVQRGALIKEYVALVHGTPPAEGHWEDLLFKDSRYNKVFVVKKERRGVKRAELAYRTLEAGDVSLVHIRLFTGRSHQIRVQFSNRGYPLVGDHKYGSRAPEKMPMLYSCRLTLFRGKTPMIFEKLPEWATSHMEGKLPPFEM